MKRKTRKEKPLQVALGVSLFSEHEFALLKLEADDRDGLDETFADYMANRSQVVNELRRNGALVVDVPLTCAEIFDYCQRIGSPNIGATRAQLVREKLAERDAEARGSAYPARSITRSIEATLDGISKGFND